MKEIQPILSIVVPIYKVEEYLDDCINSILEQTFKEFELILVDDGSPDKCGQICDKYADKDRRIKVIHKKNGGLSSARNAGINVAKAKYIGFVDSDDIIDKNMYMNLIKLASMNDADIVCCDILKFYNYKEILEKENTMENIKIFNNIEAIRNLYNDLYLDTVVAWNKIYKRSLFKDIRFPVGKLHEDEFTTYKLIYESKKIIYTNQKLYYYRQTPNSIMNSKFNVKRLDILEAFEERQKFVKQVGNKELYSDTLKAYFRLLMGMYIKCKENDLENEILNEIKEKSKKIYGECIKCINISLKTKVLFTIFRLSPSMYKMVSDIIYNN